MLPLNQILLGDCLERLKELPDASIDAAVLDPPYGLGTREPTVEEIIAYLQGAADLEHGGDFMGREWSVPSVPVWIEVFRVLKSGGHVLSFGGTRTFDLISLGLRAAGFENRDTIASQLGITVLQWIQGQGFPKSKNVHADLVKEGVPDADDWKGWGSSLKPSWEPILVFRKPLKEGTIAKQVLATGTGAINIDGCRVQYVGPVDKSSSSRTGEYGKSAPSMFLGEKQVMHGEQHSAGRWPSNLVFSHSASCRRVGTAKVDAPVINRFTDGAKPFGNGAGHAYESEQRGDAEGKEEIAVYECQDGCPVKTLDEQSGVLTTHNGGSSKGIGFCGTTRSVKRAQPQGADSGGASRFFPQFDQDPSYECVEGCPVKTLDDQSGVLKTSGGTLNRSGIGFQGGSDGNQDYVPPSEGGASRFFPQFEQETETFECVQGCPVKTLDEQSGPTKSALRNDMRDSALGRMNDDAWQPKLTARNGFDDEGGASRFFPQFEQLEAPFMYATKVSKRERDAGLPKGTNIHPTVKPQSLCRWLVRLVTPKGGTVLDPYAGSGSTLVAALKEGFNFIGIERDPEFHRIATLRVEAASPKRDIFEDMEDL